MKEKLENLINQALEKFNLNEFSNKEFGKVFKVERPKKIDFGDYSTNVGIIIGFSGSTSDIFEYLVQNKPTEISSIEMKAGFINFFFNKKYFGDNVSKIIEEGGEFGKNEILKGQKIIVEHTQPNPFKEFHIGHLMNNAIGESVFRIIKANGSDVVACSYHGDKGLHVAKAVWALRKGIEFKKAYAYGNKFYEEDETSKNEIIEINKKIYAGNQADEEIFDIYKKGMDVSLKFFDEMYKRLNSNFANDGHFYESQSGELGKILVLNNKPKVFVDGENGSVIFKGENFEPKTHTRVFLNSDGLPTYEAKELGLAQVKKLKWNFNLSITITANEQDSFFNVVEVAIGEVFPDLKGKLKHLSHGLLKLPSGKMSSRTGTIISAESMIDQVKEKVLEKIKDSEFSNDEKDNIAEIVAIGAIKYSILHQAIGGDIVFDFDKSISFEGDSGPYLQYSAVRANSILKKADGVVSISKNIPEGWETTNLERLLERFPDIVARAGVEYAPHYIATYLIELAGEFNSFYAHHKIIDEGDITSPYRLALTQAFYQVMLNGLDILGIKVPEKM